jgi:hypothetical protein
MIQIFDPQRLDAYEQLLARPQPRGLPRGSHVYHWAGDPDRRTTRLPAIMMAWLQRRHLEIDADDPLPATARTFRRTRRTVRLPNPGLRLLRPTGTG